MANLTLSLLSTTIQDTINQFRVTSSETISGLTVSDFTVDGYNHSFRHEYSNVYSVRINSYRGDTGYIRFRIPQNAVTPNLDADEDWTMYWDADDNVYLVETSNVPDTVVRSSVSSMRWRSSRSSAGQTVGIEIQMDDDINGFTLSDMEITGDITSLSSFSHYGDYNTYRANVVLPSDLSRGGSFRIQITNLESFYPGLSEAVDWTLLWDENGNLTASRTADLPVELSVSLSEDYVAISTEIIATFNLSKSAPDFTADDVQVTEGITKGVLTEVDSTTYTMSITTPTTGRGEGVISVLQNVITPGNNSVSATFTYIDSIELEISLSAAYVSHEGVVTAQIDSDFQIPSFTSGNVAVSQGATKGDALAADDTQRCFLIPVTAPSSGQGTIQVSVPEDSIGFPHDAVMAEFQYQQQIQLNITRVDRQGNTISGGFSDIEYTFKLFGFIWAKIEGDSVRNVKVNGLLRPFYHSWNSTTGIVTITGRPFVKYQNLDFIISASDINGNNVEASGSINVIDSVPMIVVPASPIIIKQGVFNSHQIQIRNDPTNVDVEGVWMNLDHTTNNQGVLITGNVPNDPLGVGSGRFLVTAENSAGVDSEYIDWELFTQAARWLPGANAGVGGYRRFRINRSVSLHIGRWYDGSPEPTLTGHRLPTGLVISGEYLSGIPTVLGRFSNIFYRITNTINGVEHTATISGGTIDVIP